VKRRLSVVGLLLAAAALSMLTIGHKSLWLDEAFSTWKASQSLTAIWITNPDTAHPPLYYTLLHGWLPVVSSEMGLRLPSAWAFLLTTAAVFTLGRKVGGYEVGWFAAAMWAVSPLAVWYAQEARMYAIAALVTIFLALGLVWHSHKGWLLFTLALIGGLYLDFTLVFLWAGLSGVWLGWWWHRGREPQPIRQWFIASLVGWVAFWPGRVFLPGLLEPLQSVASRLPLPVPMITLAWLPGLLLLVIGGGIIVYVLFVQSRTRPLFTWLIIPFCLFLTLLMLVPDLYLLKRVLLTLWPLLLCGVAWVVSQQRKPWLRTSLLGFSLAVTWLMLALVPKDDWRGVVATMNHAAAPGDLIWLASGADPLVYNYYQPEYPARVGSVAELATAAATSHTIWLISGPAPFPPLQAWLEQNSRQVAHIPFYRVDIWQYQLN